jgi:hypothetical protein
MSRRTNWLSLTAIGAAGAWAFLAASCGGQQPSTLSLRAGPVTAASRGGPVTPAGSAGTAPAECKPEDALKLCDELEISRVRVLVRRTILEEAHAAPGPTGPTGTTGTPGSSGSTGPGTGGPTDGSGSQASSWQEDGKCECGKSCRNEGELEIGPFVVDLCGQALTEGAVEIVNLPMAKDTTYESVKFVVNTIGRPDADLNDALKAMKELHASIVVEGRRMNADSTLGDFTFTTPMRVAQEHAGPFSLAPGVNPITLVVDPSAWFVGADGRVLDPEKDRGEILANIRCSMRLSTGDDDRERKEASACGTPGSSLLRSHEESRQQCRGEDEHQDWDGCHHCCGAPRACKPREPAPTPVPAPEPSPPPAPGPAPVPAPL